MVTKFSAEIVSIWRMFSSKIDKDLKKDMGNVLKETIREAEGIYPQIKETLEA
jgi:hypothetical protein